MLVKLASSLTLRPFLAFRCDLRIYLVDVAKLTNITSHRKTLTMRRLRSHFAEELCDELEPCQATCGCRADGRPDRTGRAGGSARGEQGEIGFATASPRASTPQAAMLPPEAITSAEFYAARNTIRRALTAAFLPEHRRRSGAFAGPVTAASGFGPFSTITPIHK
ncbi:hypothetical protein [Microtetraspora malaysiensis]|uniref:hypothetical protein n=1 Tax=Microtetraspora malaysiensis TaxID=161358 RepID=UPI003D89EE15